MIKVTTGIFIISILLLSLVSHPITAQTAYSLDDCERMAIKNNNRIKNGKLDIQAASQTRKEARTNYFPSVSGTGSYFNANRGLLESKIEPQDLVSPDLAGMLPAELQGALLSPISVSLMKNGMVGGVTATQPIYAGGRIVNGNKLAKLGEEVAKLQFELTEKEVILTTHTYYWQVVNLKEKLATIASVEELLNNLLKDVNVAVKAGLSTRNDVLRVELQLHDVASNRLKVENGINVSKMLLAQFIGVDMAHFDIENKEHDACREPSGFYQDAGSAVMNRPETQLLNRSINAAKLKTKISLGEQLPSIGVGGGYLYNNLLNQSNNSGVIFATVSVPISGWWGGSHAYKRNKLLEQQAINNRTNNIELMTVETNQVWNELVEAHKQILLAESSIQSATENLRMVNDSYKSGVVPLTDLLDAQVLFQQSKNLYSDAYSVYQIKVLKYRQITEN